MYTLNYLFSYKEILFGSGYNGCSLYRIYPTELFFFLCAA